MPRRRIRAHFEQLSEFERGPIIGLKEAGWANRRIARHMGQVMRPLEDAGKNGWTVADFSVMMVAVDLGPHDESHFHLCLDDNRRRVWRRPGKRAVPAFTIVRNTDPQQGFMYPGLFQQENGKPHISKKYQGEHQVFYHSVSRRVAACIQDRDGSIPY
ncbi:hypothetical protein TNCV_4668961 [Trichonephila clavipes]|nr:hypothetical protein TNCV_4668961 [Trichonephila clavipes]